jgi:hypothetical protein
LSCFIACVVVVDVFGSGYISSHGSFKFALRRWHLLALVVREAIVQPGNRAMSNWMELDLVTTD